MLDFLQFRMHREFENSDLPKCQQYLWLECFAKLNVYELDLLESFKLWLSYLDFAKIALEFIDSDFLLYLYK